MAPTIVHLPNGHNLTVSPVFGGLFFKPQDWTTNHTHFPAGWTVVLNSEDEDDASPKPYAAEDANTAEAPRRVHRYRKPTLQSDHLYISSISNPSSTDFKPATSASRQMAMMLWATLYWYFHQPEPDPRLTTPASEKTAEDGKPRGEWRININREGVFKSRVALPKLERMGLVTTEESCVGLNEGDRNGDGWFRMFVSRRAFWQLDPRIYLFTLSNLSSSPYPSGTPFPSRPSSPTSATTPKENDRSPGNGLWNPTQGGPFHSSSHLPTYYPPPPPQFVMTNGVRHPLRQKPPRQGETFYTRYIPSLGQYLSFRVATLSPKPPPHTGPVSNAQGLRVSQIELALKSVGINEGSSDVDLLHKWMNDPRVAYSWGEAGPREHQEQFLKHALNSKHSFPAIGCWDGKPFGFFEIYWVKEDHLGKHIGSDAGNYDRGLHCLVGEQEFRGSHRVRAWLSALVHFCLLADNRTESVMLEPRVDNQKFKQYLMEAGFHKQREISFPHKQANLMKLRREAWEAPAI